MPVETPVFATKKEGVYRALRDAIIRCELLPEARLVVELASDTVLAAIPAWRFECPNMRATITKFSRPVRAPSTAAC